VIVFKGSLGHVKRQAGMHTSIGNKRWQIVSTVRITMWTVVLWGDALVR